MSFWIKDSFSFQERQRIVLKLIDWVEIFSELTPAELETLLDSAEKCTFSPGDIIVREGSDGLFLYVIIDGHVRVTKTSEAGKTIELAELGPAESFGEMSLVDHEARSATVTAQSSCILLRIHERDCWKHPVAAAKMFRNISRVLSGRLREMNKSALGWRLRG